jgi:acyl-CoA dehydrogenase
MEDGLLDDLGEDLVEAILSEAGRFATEEIAPLAEVGDRQGARIADGKVTTPDGWRDLYRNWIAGGWNGLTAPKEFGGQALPQMLNIATLEMWNSGSMAFALCPTLTMGAIEAVHAHGSDALKQTYLPKLVSGEWTGTMNLTEPHAGSDLGVLKTRAERRDDGTYRISGQKIFITWGEHDAAENIIHLVLARLPDAPAGTRGISLFLVPKFLVNEDGSLGPRNDLFAHSLEHKLGIHASPTCTMIYGDGKFGGDKGAIGWLVGEENKGLVCMFTMMNNARLAVGMQGVAIAEAATQKAIAYAKERTQGKAPGWTGGGMSPIIEHPDVARMLLTMKALTQGARAIAYTCAHATDMAHRAREGAQRWQERAALLTPVAKAFATDVGVDVASLGIQVHGGMGFIEETGAARYLRDARIAPIYEGTNGIQAIDLVSRKLALSGGAGVLALISELTAIADDVGRSDLDGFGTTARRLDAAITDLAEATDWLLAQLAEGRTADVLSGATPYQRLFGLVLTGCYLAKGGMSETNGVGAESRIALCRFAAENLLAETAALKEIVINGATSLAAARRVLV